VWFATQPSAVLESLIFCAGGTPEIGFCRVFERARELSSIFCSLHLDGLRQINDEAAKTICDPQNLPIYSLVWQGGCRNRK
jgi:hypothetical protein